MLKLFLKLDNYHRKHKNSFVCLWLNLAAQAGPNLIKQAEGVSDS